MSVTEYILSVTILISSKNRKTNMAEKGRFKHKGSLARVKYKGLHHEK